ncbi:MAG TPA: Asp-tRNA(Asn)/Glu-tRNA(Gln) amidotransferase subunit GatA, partial [Acidobacteriota bacterium]|nr:Asp-tRNA(Asn)/Glu-tRNA(Gln) amidotransferase subunit GatA [Acidobacteriota bacterium]
MNELLQGTIQDLLGAYRSRKTSPTEVCAEIFARIQEDDVKLGSFLRLNREGAENDARDAEKHPELPLAGVPLAIKDVISTRGIETTCSSRILKGYVPPYDATVIARLRQAGAIILGKTNCDEFAMGSSTENSAYKLTRNPWNRDFVPGGSSGGSAAAVASSFCFGALGTDTGGSIRQPASLCGVVGLKPTYGRVSRYGLVAFGSSLDCIGPLTRSIEDAALLLKVIAGHDRMDSTSSAAPVPDYLQEMKAQSKIRVGVPQEYFASGIDPEVAAAVEKALAWMEKSGEVELKKISLRHTDAAIAVYYIVATAEASANLSRFDGVRFGYRAPGNEPLESMYGRTRARGFGPEVKRRIMLGTFALSSGYYDAYYGRAARVRSLIAKDFSDAFGNVDL